MKEEAVKDGLDIMIVRNLGLGGFVFPRKKYGQLRIKRIATDNFNYRSDEIIRRVAIKAFELANKRKGGFHKCRQGKCTGFTGFEKVAEEVARLQ